jgi:hypothetical protein
VPVPRWLLVRSDTLNTPLVFTDHENDGKLYAPFWYHGLGTGVNTGRTIARVLNSGLRVILLAQYPEYRDRRDRRSGG